MRPKKSSEERRDIVVNVRFTLAEAEQFRTQAAARNMDLGPYLRGLALVDGEALAAEEKIRRGSDGRWEIFKMGRWEAA